LDRLRELVDLKSLDYSGLMSETVAEEHPIERFVPEAQPGQLIEAEHQARYRWAAQAAAGGDVLDAACGVGYGTAILAHHGGGRTVGVDVAQEAIADAVARAGEVAEFVVGDLHELPFDDGSFDLVVCFEAIEHVSDRDRALDELRRLLRGGGLLMISSPNRRAFPSGNPHHVHEYEPEELEEALRARFEQVRLYRQQTHLTSLIADDPGFTASRPDAAVDVEVRKVVGGEPGYELYTLAIAGDRDLPELPGTALLTDTFDIKAWSERATEAERRVAELEREVARLESDARRRNVETDRRGGRLEREIAKLDQKSGAQGVLLRRAKTAARVISRVRRSRRRAGRGAFTGFPRMLDHDTRGPEPPSPRSEADSSRLLPLPPLELMERVGPVSIPAGVVPEGWAPDMIAASPWLRPGDAGETYERLGELLCDHVLEVLPADWSFRGKRVLDFGCGAGRVLRHLPSRAPGAEIWGCDIDRRSIEWLEENLSPPLHVFVNGEDPPLPQPSGAFDLILVGSVFTHLVEGWSPWLLELRRVLSDDGLLVATFINTGLNFPLQDAEWHEDWDEDQIGMHVFNAGVSWDEGGPAVYHSLWWLKAHWGRAFEFLHLQPVGWGFEKGSQYGQGIAVMRKRPGDLTREDLEAIEPDEPREVAALSYSLRNSRRETASRLREARHFAWRLESEGARLKKERDRAREVAQAFRQSRIWRVTAPLRALGRASAAANRVRRSLPSRPRELGSDANSRPS
jgi:SAM-dependent methyltransferase